SSHKGKQLQLRKHAQVHPDKNAGSFCRSHSGPGGSPESEKMLPPPDESESVGQRLPHSSHIAPMSDLAVHAGRVQSRPARNRLLFVLVVKIPATSVAA